MHTHDDLSPGALAFCVALRRLKPQNEPFTANGLTRLADAHPDTPDLGRDTEQRRAWLIELLDAGLVYRPDGPPLIRYALTPPEIACRTLKYWRNTLAQWMALRPRAWIRVRHVAALTRRVAQILGVPERLVHEPISLAVLTLVAEGNLAKGRYGLALSKRERDRAQVMDEMSAKYWPHVWREGVVGELLRKGGEL